MKKSTGVVLVSLVMLATPLWAADLYVDSASPHTVPPYISWDTAAHTIQAAVSRAADGDTVYVNGSSGTKVYTGANYDGPTRTTNVVIMSNDVAVVGVGGPIIDGQLAVRGVLMNKGQLRGFTVRNAAYGGITCFGGEIRDCSIFNNTSKDPGGGAYCDPATAWTSIIVSNCSFVNNISSNSGGGLYANGSKVRVENCRFIRNTVQHELNLAAAGGGAYLNGGTLIGCTISNNLAKGGNGAWGGGIYLGGGVTASNCVIVNNRAEIYTSTFKANGGGAAVVDSEMWNCTLANNFGNDYGGGAYLGRGSAYNCLFSKNNSYQLDSVWINDSHLFNSTVVGNTAGRGIRVQAQGEMVNCIVVSNAVSCEALTGATVTYRNNCMKPPYAGMGDENFSADPKFMNYLAGDFRLQAGSPCIDRGYNIFAWMTGGKDLGGNPRLAGSYVDVGAYETISTKTYEIGVSASPAGAGTAGGGGTKTSGSSATVTATAATGYSFVNWTEGGGAVSASSSYTFTVTDNRTLVANFAPNSYTILLDAQPGAGGSVSGGGNLKYGTSATAMATPAVGYAFVNWTEGGTPVSSSALYTFTVAGDRTLVANFALLGGAGDAYEADNASGTAQAIGNGQTQNRSIHEAGDVDWATFTVGPGGADVRVETDGASGDTQLWIYGPDNATTEAAYNDDISTDDRFSLITTNLPAGTYYIKVQEYGNDGTIPAYTLAASWTGGGGGGGGADAYEADNDSGTAQAIANGETQNRSIHVAGDVDWATFTVGADGAQNVQVQTAGASGDTQVWIYGPNNSTTEAGYNDDISTENRFSLITAPSLAAGTYYIKVQEYGDDGTIPAYTLAASWTSGGGGGGADAYEADNTVGAARSIVNGQTQSRSIHVADDVDWATFTVPSPGAVNVQVQTAGASGDTQVWLIRAGSGAEVAYSDDVSAENRFSRIAVATLEAGTYYIKVQEYGNDHEIPAYTLVARWTAASYPAADAYESDNAAAQAKPVANRVMQRRTIHRPGNVDWAKFTVPSASARNVRIETAGASGDTQVWLIRGSTGAVVAYDDNAGIGSFSLITVPALAAGIYYVKIQESGNNGTIPAYTLLASWLVGPPADAYERDDTLAAAKRIRNGRTQTRTIHRAGNRDWAKFTIGAAGAVNLKVETRGASGDTQMGIYDSAGRRLFFDDDSGPGKFSQIRRTSFPAGTYFIRVQEKGNDGMIPVYTLRASWTAN